MCVFVQDISSPNALANVSALDAVVKRVHGMFCSIRQIARRDAGTHNFLHANGHVNPSLDFQAFDDRLMAYILFTITIDGITYDVRPSARTRYTFDFGECDLHNWTKDKVKTIKTRVDPGWIPRVAALREVLDLKPRSPKGPQGSRPRPIWDASKYAHITRRIENGYQED
jgi:hypothetical protein